MTQAYGCRNRIRNSSCVLATYACAHSPIAPPRPSHAGVIVTLTPPLLVIAAACALSTELPYSIAFQCIPSVESRMISDRNR
ncbi:hypothetical protein V9T40_007338 [Parthenolecanium corni]|uniref:Uncharacterized protein n=1 Tax=Parthenolecanium corni TaxID=536013 RepID=A0AAN9YBY2_9HEMI